VAQGRFDAIPIDIHQGNVQQGRGKCHTARLRTVVHST
jgi:hypothetical protein